MHDAQAVKKEERVRRKVHRTASVGLKLGRHWMNATRRRRLAALAAAAAIASRVEVSLRVVGFPFFFASGKWVNDVVAGVLKRYRRSLYDCVG